MSKDIITRYKVDIPIIRKQYNKTNSAKFKGNLSIISNIHGVIYDWKIKFTEIHLDLYTTESWIKSKNKNFKRRKELFSLLGIKQEVRPSKKHNKLIDLTEKQVSIANDFFNNKVMYESTVKNIVAVIKGNNPGGEAKKPNSAEMIIDSNDGYKNFVILIDDLMMKHKIDYDSLAISSIDISLKQFIELNPKIESAFDFMQKSKDYTSWMQYLDGIKKYYKKYNIDVIKAYALADKARRKYSANIDNKISDYPFGFKSKNEFQKCHIYEFHDLRDLITEALYGSKEYGEYLDMIEDINNFLPLPEHIHRQFDANHFTYNENGDIIALTVEGEIFIKNSVKDVFKKIPKNFLNNGRQMYLHMRNKVNQ